MVVLRERNAFRAHLPIDPSLRVRPANGDLLFVSVALKRVPHGITLLTFTAETQAALEVVETGDGLFCCALAVLIPGEEASEVLDGAISLITADGGAPEAEGL